jgi:hypothetical protein
MTTLAPAWHLRTQWVSGAGGLRQSDGTIFELRRVGAARPRVGMYDDGISTNIPRVMSRSARQWLCEFADARPSGGGSTADLRVPHDLIRLAPHWRTKWIQQLAAPISQGDSLR